MIKKLLTGLQLIIGNYGIKILKWIRWNQEITFLILSLCIISSCIHNVSATYKITEEVEKIEIISEKLDTIQSTANVEHLNEIYKINDEIISKYLYDEEVQLLKMYSTDSMRNYEVRNASIKKVQKMAYDIQQIWSKCGYKVQINVLLINKYDDDIIEYYATESYQ